jgi:hypothetical protein
MSRSCSIIVIVVVVVGGGLASAVLLLLVVRLDGCGLPGVVATERSNGADPELCSMFVVVVVVVVVVERSVALSRRWRLSIDLVVDCRRAVA